MHSKRKGNIGQIATALFFSKMGYSTFIEQGDISKIDLIVEKDGKLLRIQCKAVTPKKDKIELYLRKSGPGYQFVYEEKSLDFFALYNLESEELYLVPSAILKRCGVSFSLRLNKSKNNQEKGVSHASSFLAEEILRDYTIGTPLSNKGDDIVQTATVVG